MQMVPKPQGALHVPAALGPKSVLLRSWNLGGQSEAIVVLPGCEMVAKVTSGFPITSFRS